jgi:hypothetical protein
MRTLRQLFSAAALATALAFGVASLDAQAPKGSTGQCKDGSYTKAQTKKGACSKHGGVQTWFADAKATAAPTSKAAPPPEKGTAPKTTATAKAPADAKDATAKCKDGTYSYAKQHRGACSSHGGVAEWYK